MYYKVTLLMVTYDTNCINLILFSKTSIGPFYKIVYYW